MEKKKRGSKGERSQSVWSKWASFKGWGGPRGKETKRGQRREDGTHSAFGVPSSGGAEMRLAGTSRKSKRTNQSEKKDFNPQKGRKGRIWGDTPSH